MVSTAMCSSVKLDPPQIISGAAFCIIGLTNIPKIEFLPLDWIYHPIRIITVFEMHQVQSATLLNLC